MHTGAAPGTADCGEGLYQLHWPAVGPCRAHGDAVAPASAFPPAGLADVSRGLAVGCGGSPVQHAYPLAVHYLGAGWPAPTR